VNTKPSAISLQELRHPPYHLRDLLADVDAGQHGRTRLRRSTGDLGSAIMLSLVTCILPASSTRTSALAASRPPTCQSAKPWKASFRLVTWVIRSRSQGSDR
jgi:hypothetical protein